MRILLFSLAVLMAASQVAEAGTPPSLEPFLDYGQYYKRDADTKAWTYIGSGTLACDKYVQEATEAGVKDDLALDVPYDTPLWPKGKHTFKELKEYCLHAKTAEAVAGMLFWAKLAQDGDIAVKCVEGYDALLKAPHGLTATTKLPFEGITIEDPATGDPFAGTLEDARKKFCDGAAKPYLEQKAKAEAPYRKVLKGAKLEVALGHLDAAFYGPGGGELKTPAALAKASVWFRHTWYKDQPCKQGADIIHTVTRYQFNGKQELVKDSAKDYCGEPPRAAYK